MAADKQTRKRARPGKGGRTAAAARKAGVRRKATKAAVRKKSAAKKAAKAARKKAAKKKTVKKSAKKTTKKKAAKAAAKKTAKKAAKKTASKKAARKVTRKAAAKRAAGARAEAGKGAARAKFTKSDLARFRALLLAQREKLLGDLQSLESQAFKTSGQDSAANHMADHGSDNYEQDFTLGLIENEEEVLRQIDQALERIEQGTYGVCEVCSEPIPIARLEFLPWTPYCVRCKEQLERPY